MADFTLSNLAFIFIVALQLAVIVMLQHAYASRTVRNMSSLLHDQSERIGQELKAAVASGTQAAHAAYKEANSVNLKIEDLNKRLLEGAQK